MRKTYRIVGFCLALTLGLFATTLATAEESAAVDAASAQHYLLQIGGMT
jgi:hypothetical protein